MITEKEYRGGEQTIDLVPISANTPISFTKGRTIRVYASGAAAGKSIKMPYAPIIRTGGPQCLIMQESGTYSFDVNDFLGTKIVTVGTVFSGQWLGLVLYLVDNTSAGGTWQYYFRDGETVQ